MILSKAYDLKVSFAAEIANSFRPEVPRPKFICKSCCAWVRLRGVVVEGREAVEAYCGLARHPSILIRDGKVLATSA